MFKILATAVALSLVAFGAQAATILASSDQNVGNTADIYGAAYSAYTPSGAVWSDDPTRLVPPGNQTSVSKSPFSGTSLQDVQSYFAVGSNDDTLGGAPSPVTLTFSGVQDAFKILWGSIDSYNSITFSLGTTDVLTYTGNQLAAALGISPATGFARYEKVALVSFEDLSFDKVTFTSSSAAFEFALAPVPLPAGGLLLIGAIGGLAALRRRKA